MAAAIASPSLPPTVPVGGYRASIAGTVRSEFTKIGSVRSTYWTLFLLVAAGVAWSIAYCAGEASRFRAWRSCRTPSRHGASVRGPSRCGSPHPISRFAIALPALYQPGPVALGSSPK